MADDLPRMAVDTETTGLDPAIDRIKSISAVVGDLRHGILHKLSLILDAEGQPSSPEALRVHRIPDIVPNAMHPRAALALLEGLQQATGAQVLMHNKAFDRAFLTAAWSRAGLRPPSWISDVSLVEDTMEIGRRHYPGQQTNLQHLARAAGIAPWLVTARGDRHDSLDDAILCFELWRKHAVPTTLDLATGQQTKVDPRSAKTAQPPNATGAAAGLDW
jgi:DNA polymerase III epsilon subunit-like protein